MKFATESKRSRWIYALLCLVTILVGLASRRYGHFLPRSIAEYAGDTLWATMVFFGLAFVFPKKSTLWLAASALAISFAVEFSQMYHVTWLDSIRSTPLGALLFGQGFLWSDLICYTAGVGLAIFVDIGLRRGE